LDIYGEYFLNLKKSVFEFWGGEYSKQFGFIMEKAKI